MSKKDVRIKQLESGHGHVYIRSDGLRTRCGGPGFCAECSRELVAVRELLDARKIHIDKVPESISRSISQVT